MQYAELGRTGLRVSRLCLGTMNFGSQTSEEDSFKIMDRALELGINFFDTADRYGGQGKLGLTEEIIGRWLAQGGRRDRIVLATKVYGPMGPGTNDRGLSAYHIRRRVPGQPEAPADRPHRPLPDAPRRPRRDRAAPGARHAGPGPSSTTRRT